LESLPPPSSRRTGWPWTVDSAPAAATRPDDLPWSRVSIVTPSYNQGQYLEETIRSILLQGYSDLEYFVIDGGSTDDSISIIRKYEPWITWWVCEKDKGRPTPSTRGWREQLARFSSLSIPMTCWHRTLCALLQET
jgi:cellulose synthase/poly-beta-1,6-N-acetylglucosamine synthase-like glycosyltransferase